MSTSHGGGAAPLQPGIFAVTSGLRLDAIPDACRDPESILTKYEDQKCEYKDTQQHCQQQGLTFIPMIIEAVGGSWGKNARRVWSELAKTSALATGELTTENSCGFQLQQRLAMCLHRENARACLRRFGS